MGRISLCKVRSGFKPPALHRIILWLVTSPSLGVLIWQMGDMMAGLFKKRRPMHGKLEAGAAGT